MAQTIDIYYQGHHIDTKTFQEFFAIARDGDTFVWFTEREEPRPYVEVYISTKEESATIKSVGSTWTLIIDNIMVGPGENRSTLIVTGRTVEFVNTDYRFVGKFSGQPLGTVADVVSYRVIEWLIEERRKKAKESEQE